MSPRNRSRNMEAEVARAEIALAAARSLLSNGFYLDAVSRTYYAAFHYAVALLMSRGLEAKTHGGLIALLGQHFVATGLIDPGVARTLSRLQTYRHDSDYAIGHVVTKEMAEADIQDAETFIAAVRQLLPGAP